MNARLGQTWQIDLNTSKTFGRHWEVKLAMNDILNTAADTHFAMFSNSRTIKMNKHNSTRAVELTVSYRFYTSKSKYTSKGAGNSEEICKENQKPYEDFLQNPLVDKRNSYLCSARLKVFDKTFYYPVLLMPS